MKSIYITLFILITLLCSQNCYADEYLKSEEIGGIAVGSVATLAIGQWMRIFDDTRASLIKGPFPMEESIQRFLAGKYNPEKRYFLDNSLGSAYTPIAFGLTLFYADLQWPKNDSDKDVAQDIFLYVAGLTATKGITSLFKGMFARSRPMISMEPELAEQRLKKIYSYDHHSFFSGHVSSAFFAGTYLNKRLRDIMRREMSASDYRDWRWVPPAVIYGWSSFVGWTRIHSYKHYLSDVLIGALAGYLLGELFYSFNDKNNSSVNNGNSTKMLFRFGFTF